MGLDHSRVSIVRPEKNEMVRPSRHDEVDAQRPLSRFTTPREIASDTTKQFHDDPAVGSLWRSKRHRPPHLHAHYAVLFRARRLDEIEVHQHSRPAVPDLRAHA